MKNLFSTLLVSGVLFCVPLRAADSASDKSPDSTRDEGLRAFLGVFSIKGDYQILPGDDRYQVKVLEFEDGKLSEKGIMSSFGSVKNSPSKFLITEILWGDYQGACRVALISSGGATRIEDAFWKKLDGSWSSLQPAERVEYQGFVILGFAQSKLTQDGRMNVGSSASFMEAIKQKKFVGALGIRMFKTDEEAKKAMDAE
jgi:hypothetical protein